MYWPLIVLLVLDSKLNFQKRERLISLTEYNEVKSLD